LCIPYILLLLAITLPRISISEFGVKINYAILYKMILTRISRFAVTWKTRQIALDRNDRESYVQLSIRELAIYAVFFVIFFTCKRRPRTTCQHNIIITNILWKHYTSIPVLQRPTTVHYTGCNRKTWQIK